MSFKKKWCFQEKNRKKKTAVICKTLSILLAVKKIQLKSQKREKTLNCEKLSKATPNTGQAGPKNLGRHQKNLKKKVTETFSKKWSDKKVFFQMNFIFPRRKKKACLPNLKIAFAEPTVVCKNTMNKKKHWKNAFFLSFSARGAKEQQPQWSAVQFGYYTTYLSFWLQMITTWVMIRTAQINLYPLFLSAS